MKAQVRDAGVEVTIGQISHVKKQGALTQVIHIEENGQEPKVTSALRTIVAIGRSGNFRQLGVPGEELDKVMNRLHDPRDFEGKKVVVVGGGDSAVEAAVSLVECGAEVTLSYRKPELNRPKPENVETLTALSSSKDAALTLALGTTPVEVTERSFSYRNGNGDVETVENDVVFAMIGREAPLDFFRRSGISIAGERDAKWVLTACLSVLFFTFLYLWKGGDSNLDALGVGMWAWPGSMPQWIAGLGADWASLVQDRSEIVGTLAVSMKSRSFYYTLTYCILVTVFGVNRMRRRRTPYVRRQTLTLMAIQWLPLFIIPEILLPWLGYNGAFEYGSLWDQVFEPYISQGDYVAQSWPDWGHPRAYWRAYGVILAWPLFVYNLFTEQPMWIWLIIGLVQTLVLIPWMVRRWGKGAYCGWICSCGALAETVGDKHRHKMPHGPFWNRLNMVGQVFLGFALLLLVLRIIGWAIPGQDIFDQWFGYLFNYDKKTVAGYFSYGFIVDVIFSGIIGVAFYFHLSGRVWCRFACPLAALMHLYSRLGRFRIFSDKKKCISCNVCTSVCHQGIDVMQFANKGIPMEDPQCVRCSACVQSCPTGVLSFGRYSKLPKDGDGGKIILDGLQASPVKIDEEEI